MLPLKSCLFLIMCLLAHLFACLVGWLVGFACFVLLRSFRFVVLFCFVLLCFALLCFALLCFALLCFVLFCFDGSVFARNIR